MVLPLRFPPGMAGGLLLAYPRMKKPDHSAYGAGREGFSRLYYIPAPSLVNFGERDFRQGQSFPAFRSR